jgi:hypothetical protein
MSGSLVKLHDGGLLQSLWGSMHCFLVGLIFYCSICNGGVGRTCGSERLIR